MAENETGPRLTETQRWIVDSIEEVFRRMVQQMRSEDPKRSVKTIVEEVKRRAMSAYGHDFWRGLFGKVDLRSMIAAAANRILDTIVNGKPHETSTRGGSSSPREEA